MSKSIIFYGAGKNARENCDNWVKQVGEPVCFVDVDVSKHYTKFDENRMRGGVILPLLEAINKYPDYELWITLIEESLKSVTVQLLGLGIPAERIKYCEIPFPDPMYCPCLMENTYMCYDTSGDGAIVLYLDCITGFCKFNYSSGNAQIDMRQNERDTLETRTQLSMGLRNRCYGCNGVTCIEPKKTGRYWVNFATGVTDCHMCNFECIYCCGENGLRKEHLGKTKSRLEYVKDMEAFYGELPVHLVCGGGEICIGKSNDEFLEIVRNHPNWTIAIASNCSIYSSKIYCLLQSGQAMLDVSLDAGTAKTFALIKGLNNAHFMFDRVRENVAKYAETGGYIQLKYIMIEGLNDNKEDIDGFWDYAKDNAKTTQIDFDLTKQWTRQTSGNLIDMAMYFIDKAYENNIKVIPPHYHAMNREEFSLIIDKIRMMDEIRERNKTAIQ
jgi:pyruvate-formate lyase-activating enzyme